MHTVLCYSEIGLKYLHLRYSKRVTPVQKTNAHCWYDVLGRRVPWPERDMYEVVSTLYPLPQTPPKLV